MNTNIEINGGIEMKLSDALLIYTADSRAAYVTRHSIANGQLGPAKPLSEDFLTKLSEELERRVKLEVLPEKVLVRTPNTIVWWTPARRRKMYFTASDEDKVANLSGKLYAHPALIWMVTGHSLTIRALASNDRPTETTKLYRAPYWNTGDSGLVCTGDMKRPDTTTARTIDQWEDGFYASRFSHPNATKLVEWPKPYIDFLRNVLLEDDGCPAFPTEHLVDAKQTLEQFIGGGR